MSTAAAWDLNVAVVAALEADATLAAVIGADGVYGDDPPPDRALPYLTLDLVRELADDAFQGIGHQTAIDLHAWATTREGVLELYGHVARILDARQLAVNGQRFDGGRVVLVSILRDPTGPRHAVMTYTAFTRVAA